MSKSSFAFGVAKIQKMLQKTKNVSGNVFFLSKCLQNSEKSYKFAAVKNK
jgi:hypothetical protein